MRSRERAGLGVVSGGTHACGSVSAAGVLVVPSVRHVLSVESFALRALVLMLVLVLVVLVMSDNKHQD